MIKALYKITNNINGKIYIGQSIHPNRRWIEHKTCALNHQDELPIHNAIAKYGVEAFSFEILEWSEQYDQREKDLIAQYNSLAPNGYNILDGTSNNPVMYGEDHPRNTLTNEQVKQIIQLLQKEQLTDVDIAKQIHTTAKIVSDINHGITHKQLDLTYPIRLKKGRTGGISTETRLQIIQDLATTKLSYTALSKKYNLSKGMIGHINHGRYNPIEGIEYPIRRSQ